MCVFFRARQAVVHPAPPSNTFQNSIKTISRSAYDIDSLAHEDRNKSSSLQHLENSVVSGRSHHTRSRNLHNINENLSATENENSDGDLRDDVSPISDLKSKQKNHKTLSSPSKVPPQKSSSKFTSNVQNNNSSLDEDETDMTFEKKRHLFEESYHRAQQNQQQRSTKSRDPSRERSPAFLQNQTQQYENQILRRENDDYKKPPPGPPKPARTIDRRRGMSR